MNHLLISAYRLGRDRHAASAAEFALVLPLFLLFLLGTIDAGRFAWEFNRGEKATQTAARWAAVTNILEPGLADYSLVGVDVGGTTLTQGDIVPADALGTISCTSAGCNCTGACDYTPGTFDQNAWDDLLARMQQIWPAVTAQNLVVEYRGSGLGFAGDPNGADISALVTVRLQNMQFFPLSLFLFTGNLSLPDFSYTLPMEDGDGEFSN